MSNHSPSLNHSSDNDREDGYVNATALNSGWELARAKEETLLKVAQESQQPIVIFRPEGKPASASFLSFLIDAEQNSLEDFQVSNLVPIYNLEGLDDEEKESAINTSITDAIGRTLQFFPKQKEFEILMPEGQRVKYTSTLYTNKNQSMPIASVKLALLKSVLARSAPVRLAPVKLVA